jgi:hypothetical protein
MDEHRQNNNNNKKNNAFNKRCPFCGLQFHQRTKMAQHFAQRHSEQIGNQQIDIDTLPQADELVPSTTIGMDLLLQSVMGAAAGAAETNAAATMMASTTNANGPLDLSVGSRLLVNGNANPYE